MRYSPRGPMTYQPVRQHAEVVRRQQAIPVAENVGRSKIRGNGTVQFFGHTYQFDVRRDAMLRFWPKGRVSLASAEEESRWCTNYLKSHGQVVPKTKLRKLAIERFGISMRGFNFRVWPRAIVEAGVEELASKPGRKKNRIG